MPRKNSTSKRIIKRTPRKPAKRKAPAQGFDRKEFERGLLAFSAEAYDHALDFYAKHSNDPAALSDLQIRNPGLIDPAWVELSNAVRFIATCDFAPLGLKQPVVDFLSSESGEIWGALMVRPPVIQRILVAASCREEDSDDEK